MIKTSYFFRWFAHDENSKSSGLELSVAAKTIILNNRKQIIGFYNIRKNMLLQ